MDVASTNDEAAHVANAPAPSRGPYLGTAEESRKVKDQGSRDLRVLGRLGTLVAPHRGRLVIAVLSLFAASGLTLVYPWAARYAVDDGMKAATAAGFDKIILGLLAMFLLHAAMVWIRHYSMSWLGERVVTDLRTLVFSRLLRLPLHWFYERRSGELVGRLASDVTVIEGVVGTDLSMALRNGVQFVGGIVFLVVINVKLTLLMLAIVPPIVLVTMWFGKKIRVMSRDVQDELAKVSGHVQEAIGAIATVQAFVREPAEAHRYQQGVEQTFARTLKMVRWRSSFFSVAMTAGYAGVALVFWLGGRALIAGEITSGQLTSFFIYTFMIAGAIGELAGIWASLQRAAGATERLFAVIDTVPDIRDAEVTTALPEGHGAIEFHEVTYAYPARKEMPVLRGVSLAIAPGEVVALVGPSGAGKSTFLSLLYRFADVDGGHISYEGIDVRQLPLTQLRQSLAMVAQEPVLFSGTIADNIAYGRQGAAQAEIEKAARDANAHDFIMSFPDGYQTVIGERGTKLSGGQKQRVAIARAILADPRVLILDEATSNLDAESEAQVQGALARLKRGRTTLIVAHRLSTVRDADRIVVLDGGRIVEQGKHDALLAAGGVYKRLIEHQVVGEPRVVEPSTT